MKKSRTLSFQQITDSRRHKREDCLPILETRIDEIKKLLNIEGVELTVGSPYLLEWGNKEDEGKLPENYLKNPWDFDTDLYHIQYRANFKVKKHTRKVTWNDIYGLVNSVKAVPYDFI